MSDLVVRIRDLSKHFEGYPKAALKGINCEIQRGHIVGLVGPDGAGKTTLLRLIAGLLLPKTGSIEVYPNRLKNGDLDRVKTPGVDDLSPILIILSRQRSSTRGSFHAGPKPILQRTFARLLKFTDLKGVSPLVKNGKPLNDVKS